MLNVQDLSSAIDQVSKGVASVHAFERWLRRESQNVHAWGSKELNDAVMSLESVLSSFHFDGLEEGRVAAALLEAIRPFAETEKK